MPKACMEGGVLSSETGSVPFWENKIPALQCQVWVAGRNQTKTLFLTV